MYQIISDGSCDFTKEEVKKHNIQVIPFYITFDGTTHLKEGVDITKAAYFKRLLEEKNLFPKTSQPSPQDYIDIFTPYLKAGKDILSLTISSKLSGSYNSATLAAGMLQVEFPDRKIKVVDTQTVSISHGLILKEIIKMRDAGRTLEDTVHLTKEVIKSARVYFTLDSLEYLKRGGRVGPTTALVGGILGLRPILHLENGQVAQLDNVRGKKRVLKLMEEALVDALKDDKKNVNISIGHILNANDADIFKANLENALSMKISSPVTEVGATIGTHAGPGAMALAYCKKYEAL